MSIFILSYFVSLPKPKKQILMAFLLQFINSHRQILYSLGIKICGEPSLLFILKVLYYKVISKSFMFFLIFLQTVLHTMIPKRLLVQLFLINTFPLKIFNHGQVLNILHKCRCTVFII